VARLGVLDDASNVLSSASLEAGELVKLELPAERVWEGLHLKAELIVTGVHHSICWDYREVINADGSITLKRKQYV
jgi:hypothetical protein